MKQKSETKPKISKDQIKTYLMKHPQILQGAILNAYELLDAFQREPTPMKTLYPIFEELVAGGFFQDTEVSTIVYKGVVKMDLDGIVSRDLEWFLDQLSRKLVGYCLLQNPTHLLIGYENTTLFLEVEGYMEW